MAQHSEPVSGGMAIPWSVRPQRRAHRPGMVTFAAVIMFVVAGFEALSAILAFAGTGWWVTDLGQPGVRELRFLGHPRPGHRGTRGLCGRRS